MRNYRDTAWKDVLDAYFADFIAFCLPVLNELIDWSKAWFSLDKELHAITKNAEIGMRLVDKLFKVFLKDGAERWVLIHIEVQGTPDKDFPKRMFTYAYRIFDKHKQVVVSCAILTDERESWRPNYYEVALVGSVLRIDYLVIKLIDYRAQREMLEKASNPFASVILVQLAALDAKTKTEPEKYRIKFALTRRLYEKGFSKVQIEKLYLFIDWLITLSEPLELEYLNEIYQLEAANKMAYISNAERFGIKKGILQGLQEGLQEGLQKGLQEGLQEGRQEGEATLLVRLLTRKFGEVPASYRKRIQYADAETLLVWGEQILDAQTFDEVFA